MAENNPRQPKLYALQEQDIAVVFIGKRIRKVIFRGGFPAARFAVFDFLNVAETAGNPTVAVGVEGIEVDRNTRVATGIDFAVIQNRVYAAVNDLRGRSAVGVDKEAVFVRFVVAFRIAVAQREFQRRFVRRLPAEFCNAFLNGVIDGVVDIVDGLFVIL